MSARLAAALALLAFGLMAQAALTPPYAALIAQVASGNEADRRTFARVALEQMAADYDAEATRGHKADARWRNYLQQEAAVLRSRAARIDEARQITLALDGPDGVRLIIDSENVIISSPRLDAADRLEAAIVAEACLYIPCAAPLPADADPRVASPDPEGQREAFGPADAPAERTWPRLAVQGTELPTGRWFQLEGGAATYRTANGLNFQFKQPGARQAALAALCERIGQDMEGLAAALAHAGAQRWPLVWEYLRLGPVLDGEQSVVINPLGDAFLLPMQEAAIVGRLLPASQGWLQRRAAGEGSQQYFPEADRLLVLANPASAGTAHTRDGSHPAAPAAPAAAGPSAPVPVPGSAPSAAPAAPNDRAIDASAPPLPPGWRPL
jgi:hypothetical protein